MQALRERFNDRVEFIVVDVQNEEGQGLIQEFGVNSIPALFILNQQGNEVYNNVGYTQEPIIVDVLEELLKK